MATISAISQRMTFDNAVSLLQSQGVNSVKARLTQSYIRAEVLAATNKTVYNFPILVNQPDESNFSTQEKLNLQDAFVASEFGLFVAAPASATATAFGLTTYDDETILGAAPAAAINSMYNGKLVVTLNNNVIVPNWDALRCKFVPRQQGTAVQEVNNLNFSENGFYPVEPNLVISGAGNYQIQLVLPSALSAVAANQRIVLIIRGILAQNVTAVQ